MNINKASDLVGSVAIYGYPVLLLVTTNSHWVLLQMAVFWALLILAVQLARRETVEHSDSPPPTNK